ncbi:MAG: type I methionyl aminopeptidase [Flavobacteriales bacterium]|jgi:methionyl aminopeptidase|nr:type I methionyl aminopeptidase [Flavobacteriales bacterium]
MIKLKTEEEIDLIRESSLLVAKTHAEVAQWIEPGVTGMKLDKIAEEFIRDNGGIPAFKGYGGFPGTLCISPDDEVVHGIPNNKPFEEGTILSLDCGVKMNGYFGDSAFTYAVGQISQEDQKLLDITRESLYKGIEQAVEGNRIGDISYAIQQHVEQYGYGVVRELVGHGVGKELHEDPQVPNYGKRGRGPKLKNGLVIAIEPMINQATRKVKFYPDGWTVKTHDNKKSAHFEHTIVVRQDQAEILSNFDLIDQAINKKKNG